MIIIIITSTYHNVKNEIKYTYFHLTVKEGDDILSLRMQRTGAKQWIYYS